MEYGPGVSHLRVVSYLPPPWEPSSGEVATQLHTKAGDWIEFYIHPNVYGISGFHKKKCGGYSFDFFLVVP